MAALKEQIHCVERELRMRRQVYPRRIADGRMNRNHANSEIAIMEAVLETLKRLRAEEELPL